MYEWNFMSYRLYAGVQQQKKKIYIEMLQIPSPHHF